MTAIPQPCWVVAVMLIAAMHGTGTVASSLPTCYAQPGAAVPPLVNSVDHVMLGPSTLADANASFALLTETLGLPVAWPFRMFGNITSGGIALGNLNVEIARLGPDGAAYTATGFGFQQCACNLNTTQSALTTLGIVSQLYADLPGPFGFQVLTFAWSAHASPLSPVFLPFFCQYNYDMWTHKALLWRDLASSGGGVLGVQFATAVVLTGTDQDAIVLTQLLGEPASPEHMPVMVEASSDLTCWFVGAGPALCLQQSGEAAVKRVEMQVANLAAAQEAARRAHVLGPTGPGWFELNLPLAVALRCVMAHTHTDGALTAPATTRSPRARLSRNQ